jgi:hypothetical protein
LSPENGSNQDTKTPRHGTAYKEDHKLQIQPNEDGHKTQVDEEGFTQVSRQRGQRTPKDPPQFHSLANPPRSNTVLNTLELQPNIPNDIIGEQEPTSGTPESQKNQREASNPISFSQNIPKTLPFQESMHACPDSEVDLSSAPHLCQSNRSKTQIPTMPQLDGESSQVHMDDTYREPGSLVEKEGINDCRNDWVLSCRGQKRL